MLAAGAARRGAAIKLAVPAGILFFVMLLGIGIVGGIAGGSQASAASCGDAGQPDTEYGDGDTDSSSKDDTDGLHAQQLANAKIIDEEATKAGLPGRATLIGLMTALQESTLLNLDHGDADSIGVFQQRPLAGWGTKQQIMNVHYAARMFFLGDEDGSPEGLTDKNWENKGLGEAAQSVQRSRYPTLYDGQEAEARRIAKEAGINLTRAGKPTGNRPPPSASGDMSQNPNGEIPTNRCSDSGEARDSAKPGQAFHDGSAPWPNQVENPRSTEDAIAWARREASSGSKEWYRKCLAFVAQAYGWSYSGTLYAIDHYYEMPLSMRHNRDRNPPVGALMYWRTSSRAGHVAIYVGNGQIASNDIRVAGQISVVPAEDIENKWGSTYVGWAPPHFPKAG